MFHGIKVHNLDDPDFKEDSVRELILTPILARLGYLAVGETRVIRSKSLKHPFIRIGTRNHPVTVIPDYTLVHQDKSIFILDAKAPSERVLDDRHVQQAYSYAMHPEIACREFGLCNGKQLAIFSVLQHRPLVVLQFDEFESRWADIERYLSLRFLLKPSLRKFAPDYGLALRRIGFTQDTILMMYGVCLDLFCRVTGELYTASANTPIGELDHCVSFDFKATLLPKVLSGLPQPLREQFNGALNRAPFQASAGLALELDLSARLGEITMGRDEEFIPLVVEEVLGSRLNLEPTLEDPKDVPDYVLQLRNAFRTRPI